PCQSRLRRSKGDPDASRRLRVPSCRRPGSPVPQSVTENTPRRFTRPATPSDWERLQRGLRVVTRRLRASTSQEAAADAAGVSIGVIKNIEGEKSGPTLRSVLALAHSFGLLASELIERAEAFEQARPLSGREAMLKVVTETGSA